MPPVPNPPPAATPDALPIPPRYWWWRRLWWAAYALLALVVATYAIWWYEAHRRLQATLSEIRARGEPLFARDFTAPKITPGTNAAPFLFALAEDLSALQFHDGKLEDQWLATPGLLEKPLATEQVPLDVLREKSADFARAIACGHWDCGVRIRTPLIHVHVPDLSPQRQLSKLMNALARYEADTGNVAEALALSRDLLRHAEMLGEDPILISMLNSLGLEALARDTIHRVVPLVEPTDRAARAHLKAILSRLIDDAPARLFARWAIFGERACQVDMLETATYQLEEFETTGWLLRFLTPMMTPARRLDLVASLRHYDRWIQAIDAPNRAAARALLPPELPRTGFERVWRLYSELTLPALNNAVMRHHDRLDGRRRLAAEIAKRLFEMDRGRPATSVEELVPRYLPEPYPEAALLFPASRPGVPASGEAAGDGAEVDQQQGD